MKLKKLLNESEGTATILLLFDKLKRSPSFIEALNQLKMPLDKYNAIMKFAETIGITEDKFDAFMTNMKNQKTSQENGQ
jgi:hypothetical protein